MMIRSRSRLSHGDVMRIHSMQIGSIITSTRAPLTTGRRRLRIKGRKLRDRECVVEQVATEHAAYVCVDAKMWHKEDNT